MGCIGEALRNALLGRVVDSSVGDREIVEDDRSAGFGHGLRPRSTHGSGSGQRGREGPPGRAPRQRCAVQPLAGVRHTPGRRARTTPLPCPTVRRLDLRACDAAVGGNGSLLRRGGRGAGGPRHRVGGVLAGSAGKGVTAGILGGIAQQRDAGDPVRIDGRGASADFLGEL